MTVRRNPRSQAAPLIGRRIAPDDLEGVLAGLLFHIVEAVATVRIRLFDRDRQVVTESVIILLALHIANLGKRHRRSIGAQHPASELGAGLDVRDPQ